MSFHHPMVIAIKIFEGIGYNDASSPHSYDVRWEIGKMIILNEIKYKQNWNHH